MSNDFQTNNEFLDHNDLAFLSAYSQVLQAANNSQISQEHFKYVISDLMKKYTQFVMHQHKELSTFQLLSNDIHLTNDHYRVLEC